MMLIQPTAPQERRARWMVFLISVAVTVGFALFTDHRWEDYYITFRSSKNLANGLGLVYQVGERVHTFTSPIGVLLPAAASALTGGHSDDAALWVFRLFSVGAFGGTAVLLWMVTGAWNWSRFSRIFVVAALVTDAKSVDFSINGMETAFMLLFLAGTIHALARGGRGSVLQLGIAWGGLMWTRPDGCIFIGALALAGWLFVRGQSIAPGRAALLRAYIRAGLVCSAIYLPWLLFAWSYYGSPVPNTIVAKGLGLPRPDVAEFLWNTLLMPVRTIWSSPLDQTFAPSYYFGGGWPQSIVHVGRLMAWLAMIHFLVPGARPEARLVSAAVFIVACYFRSIWLFPWYLPPSTLLASIVLGGCAEKLREIALPHSIWRQIWPAPFVAALATMTLMLAATGWQMRCQQRIIEGQRRHVGEWLATHRTSDHDSVFLEPIGYIGFYSQLKIFDFPGLTSPEVLAARRVVGDDWQTLIGVLAPTWVVARPGEPHTARPPGAPSPFTDHYTLVATFDATREVANIPFLPGRGYLRGDQTFQIFKRHN